VFPGRGAGGIPLVTPPTVSVTPFVAPPTVSVTCFEALTLALVVVADKLRLSLNLHAFVLQCMPGEENTYTLEEISHYEYV
jgi:hypothetical protein